MSKTFKVAAMIAALAVSASAHAFYRCRTNNGVSYQDQSCDGVAGKKYLQAAAKDAISFTGEHTSMPTDMASSTAGAGQTNQAGARYADRIPRARE